MLTVRGCAFPASLYYDVPRHTWYAEADAGSVRVGMTPVAIVQAREVLVFTPRRPGMEFEEGRSFATIESAKWVGAVRAAFSGTIVAVNDLLTQSAQSANRDCYGEGWMLLVKPASGSWRDHLVTGQAVEAAYEAWMESAGFAGCREAAWVPGMVREK